MNFFRSTTRRSFVKGGAGLGLVTLTNSCFKNPTQQTAKERRLNLYHWRYYTGKNTISDFEKQFNVRVTTDYYASNDELFGRLTATPGQYDLIVPSDYMIETLIKNTMLDRIDSRRLKNLDNIEGLFRNQWFDPQNEYSVPYMWGSNGFGRNRKLVPSPVSDWDSLLAEKNRGKVGIIDDFRFTLGAVLKHIGLDANSISEVDLNKAGRYLLGKRQVIRTFSQDTPKEQLIAGDLSLAYGAGGDILQAAVENPALAYDLPSAGTIIFQDGMCIPKGAPNLDVAYDFIDFILRPEVSADITNTVLYGNPNHRARQLIRPDILNNESIFPSDDYIKNKCSHIHWIDDSAKALYARIWNEIKAG
jgi:spermidine/putrescine transport system substrate-binding protein